VKLHFHDDPAEETFVTRNPYTGKAMVFIMDCKVLIFHGFISQVVYFNCFLSQRTPPIK